MGNTPYKPSELPPASSKPQSVGFFGRKRSWPPFGNKEWNCFVLMQDLAAPVSYSQFMLVLLIDTLTLGLASPSPAILGMMFAQTFFTNAVEMEQIVITQLINFCGEPTRGCISSLEKKPNLSLLREQHFR